MIPDLPPSVAGAEPVQRVVRGLRSGGIAWVRRWHRLHVEVLAPLPEEPALIVANHGFGGIVDVNIFATLAALDEAGLTRPLTALTHQLAWTLKVGPLLEPLGAVPASRRAVTEALAAGHHVLVFPGGDVDAAQPWSRRNTVTFDGRDGFARMAREHDVPLVPVATAGAGETLLVLAEGRGIARALRLGRPPFRTKAFPVSLSVPWGLSVGVVGLVPYLPLPAKLTTQVLPAIDPRSEPSPRALALRVQTVLQESLDAMTASRRPLLG